MAEAEYKINLHAHVAGLKRLSARANAAASTATTSASRKLSFSFAGYGCKVIEHLRRCRVQIERGLSDEEFEKIEALFQFTFPPDLRGVLSKGVPVGDGFPNWRSGGPQQLKMWINKPRAGLLADVERGVFWLKQWGSRPIDAENAVQIARRQMKKAPVLLPVYGHCYVAASPVRAGNPVFFVQGRDVYCCGLDVSDFFHRDSFASRSLVRSSEFVPDPVFLPEFAKSSSNNRLASKSSCEDNDFLSLYEEEDEEMMMDSVSSSYATTPLRKICDVGGGVPSAETWSRSLDALACRRKSNDSARSVLSPRSSSGSSSCGSCDDLPSVSGASSHKSSSSVSGGRRGRRIEFWSDLSEKGQSMNVVPDWEVEEETEFIEFDGLSRSYQQDEDESLQSASSYVKETVEDLASRLRRGGWKEEDVAEIVDSSVSSSSDYKKGLPDRQTVLEGLALHLDYLSCSLRKAGWSVHDVAESLCFDFPAVSEKRSRGGSKVLLSPQVSERIGMLAAFVAQG